MGINSPPVVPLGVQLFEASGTYTPTPGTLYAKVWVVGGGGGRSTNSNRNGTSGSLSMKYVKRRDMGATETVTVGAGGSSGTSGNPGTNTTFGAHVTGTGGPSGSTGTDARSNDGDINWPGRAGGTPTGAPQIGEGTAIFGMPHTGSNAVPGLYGSGAHGTAAGQPGVCVVEEFGFG